jgi:hypothetical protein
MQLLEHTKYAVQCSGCTGRKIRDGISTKGDEKLA